MTRYVEHTVTDHVAHVRLARPDKLNALTLDTLDQLIETARELRKDRSLRAVVLSGDGDSFCAGLDFGTVMQNPRRIATSFVPNPWRGTNRFQEACWAWRRLPVPVIAAVHGHCLGGGLQIALGADFRIATPDSTWSVLEGKWGIIPDMSGVASLAEVIGMDQAKLLTMTARMISGKEARDLGLVTDLAPDPIAASYELAAELATKSPDALAAAKRLFNDTWQASPRRVFARERIEQVPLLFAANTKALRKAVAAKAAPVFGPRGGLR
ncbi:MAG TPA: crotonase/enoyl-CoA hydratase family protein [Marmoricola sp.]|nr:crotonase/enoyl-CoA hydratase family protein [Marmoricola sp.]